jgi:hypothetical protein
MEDTWKGYEGISGNLIYNFADIQSIKNYSLSVPSNIKSTFFITSTINEFLTVRFYLDSSPISSNKSLIDQICFDYKFNLSKVDYNYIVKLNETNTTRLYYLIKSKILNMENKTNINAVYEKHNNTASPLWNATSLDGGAYDEKGNSDHYQKQFMEFVRSTERLYGTVIAYLICVGNIDKYAGRAGEKAGVPAEKDLIKKSWYTKASVHFKKKIEAERNKTVAEDRNAFVHMPEEVVDVITADKAFKDIFHIPYVTLSTAIEK